MFNTQRVGRGNAAAAQNSAIEESAYKNRYVFRTVCLVTAVGLLLAVVLSTVPQSAVNLVRLSLGEFHASEILPEKEEGVTFIQGGYADMSTPRLDEMTALLEEISAQDAFYNSVKTGNTELSNYITRYSAAEANAKVDAIRAEQERLEAEAKAAQAAKEAAVAASTVYSGYGSYIGLNTNGVAMSEKGSVEVDEYGVPLHYSYVITGKATAYSGDTITSTGTTPVQGTVAVDPSEIPYGTRLYIASADGKYVYGYAVAEDTGGFIYYTNGATVDLFMYSEADCDEWGWRTANIYVLD